MTVHQAGIGVIVRQLNLLSSFGQEVNVLCPDGNVYSMLVLMMCLVMDHDETERHCLKALAEPNAATLAAAAAEPGAGGRRGGLRVGGLCGGCRRLRRRGDLASIRACLLERPIPPEILSGRHRPAGSASSLPPPRPPPHTHAHTSVSARHARRTSRCGLQPRRDAATAPRRRPSAVSPTPLLLLSLLTPILPSPQITLEHVSRTPRWPPPLLPAAVAAASARVRARSRSSSAYSVRVPARGGSSSRGRRPAGAAGPAGLRRTGAMRACARRARGCRACARLRWGGGHWGLQWGRVSAF